MQRVHKEGRLITIPRNDVDLFALQFVHDGLHTAAAHTDASADRVDRVVIGNHGNLGARTRVTGDGLDLDDAIIDFRHFHLEEFRHELRVGARQEHLRAARLATDVLDIAADAVAGAIRLAADLFVAAQNRFATANIDDDVAVFLALDLTVDDRALAVAEFFVLTVALGLTDLLQDHLLGRLRGDTAQINRGNFVNHLVAKLRVGEIGFGLLDRQLSVMVFHRVIFHHGADAGKAGAAGLTVDLHPDVHFRAIARLGRAGEAVFHRLNHQFGVDHLLARDRFGGLQKFKLVG